MLTCVFLYVCMCFLLGGSIKLIMLFDCCAPRMGGGGANF